VKLPSGITWKEFFIPGKLYQAAYGKLSVPGPLMFVRWTDDPVAGNLELLDAEGNLCYVALQVGFAPDVLWNRVL